MQDFGELGINAVDPLAILLSSPFFGQYSLTKCDHFPQFCVWAPNWAWRIHTLLSSAKLWSVTEWLLQSTCMKSPAVLAAHTSAEAAVSAFVSISAKISNAGKQTRRSCRRGALIPFGNLVRSGCPFSTINEKLRSHPRGGGELLLELSQC